MERFLLQTFAELESQRLHQAHELVHFTESLATTVIEEYSEPGDLVLDPFTGFGTALVVAERLGRRVVGVELLDTRAQQAGSRLADPDAVVRGDARALSEHVHEQATLVLTSPPYMTRNDHPENPLEAYQSATGSYQTYLRDIAGIFAQVADVLTPGGHAVVNAANVLHQGVLTTLAWDLARVIGAHLTLVQECYLAWDTQPPDISGDYCLVFRKT